MRLTFGWLWLLWFVGVVADVALVKFGWTFSSRSIVDRMMGQIDIAWFIFTAWFTVRLVEFFERRYSHGP